MKKFVWVCLALGVFVGCKTTDEPKPVTWERQQAYLKKSRDPRIFGLGIHQTPDGVILGGGGRLHPSQATAVGILLRDPWRPVVYVGSKPKQEVPVLIDLTVSTSLFGFDAALEMRAHPVSEGPAKMVNLPGEDASGCISMVPSIRFGLLFVENPLVVVRLANGLPDGAVRGDLDPQPKAVLGWDVFQEFEQIQFLYSIGQIVMKTTEAYEPNPNLLLANIPILERRGVCAVEGVLDGKAVPVLIDPAGDFEVAVPQGTAVSTLQLADGVAVSDPVVAVSSGGVRVGARFLERYRVTVCPKRGRVYFEFSPQIDE